MLWQLGGSQPSEPVWLPACPGEPDVMTLAFSSTGLLLGATSHGALAVWHPSR